MHTGDVPQRSDDPIVAVHLPNLLRARERVAADVRLRGVGAGIRIGRRADAAEEQTEDENPRETPLHRRTPESGSGRCRLYSTATSLTAMPARGVDASRAGRPRSGRVDSGSRRRAPQSALSVCVIGEKRGRSSPTLCGGMVTVQPTSPECLDRPSCGIRGRRWRQS